jgi:hypothetical protein
MIAGDEMETHVSRFVSILLWFFDSRPLEVLVRAARTKET